MLSSWLSTTRQLLSRRLSAPRRARRRLEVERLEDRLVPAMLYWDTNGATAGLGGTGNWDTSTANWSTSASGDVATQAWIAGSDAVFTGTTGAVTVTAPVDAAALVFEANAYTIAAGAGDIALSGTGAITVASGFSATINETIGGSVGLTKLGAGTLVLSSGTPNTYTGLTTVSEGTLRLATSNQIPDGSILTVAATGVLDLNGQNDTVAGLNGDGSVVVPTASSLPEGFVAQTFFTDDAGTGISDSKTYTHKLDFGQDTSAPTINGVAFTGVNGFSGPGYSLPDSNASHPGPGTGSLGTGNIATLLRDFIYQTGAGAQAITLTGLTVGVQYETRFYIRRWDTGNRVQSISFDADGSGPGTPAVFTVLDEDGTNQPSYFGYRFTAAATEVAYRFVPVPNPSASFHFYGLTNEVVPPPTSTLTVGGAGAYSFSGIISGAGSLIKDGTGTQALSGTNTYTGTTTVNAGTLQVDANAPAGSAGALGNASSAILLGATSGAASASLVIGGAGVSIGRDITVRSGSSGVKTLGYTPATGTGTFSGTVALSNPVTLDVATGGTLNVTTGISGAGSLTKIGGGTASLVGTGILYSGATTIDAGTLELQDATAFVSSSVTNNGALILNQTAGSQSFSVPISGSGTLEKTGGGTVTLGGSIGNTYSGLTTVSEGTLLLAKLVGNAIGGHLAIGDADANVETVQLLGPNQIADASVVTVNATGLLDLNGQNDTVAGLNGTGSILVPTAPISTLDGLVAQTFFTTDAGTGISSSKTYTHTLDFGQDTSAPTINGVAFTGVNVFSGPGYSFTGSDQTHAGAGGAAIGATGDIVALLTDFFYRGSNGTEIITLTGLIPGVQYETRFYIRRWAASPRVQSISFDADGSGPGTPAEFTVLDEDASATPSYFGFRFTATATEVTYGFVPVPNPSASFHFYGLSNEVVPPGGTSTSTLTLGGSGAYSFSGVVSGEGNLVVQAPGGIHTLGGTNTYTGTTTVNAGTLVAASDGALGTAANGTTVASGATLAFDNVSYATAESVSVQGTGVGGAGAILNVAGTSSFAGAVTLVANATFGADAGVLDLGGAVDLAGRILTATGAGDMEISGQISGTTGLVKNGAGTLTLSGNNNYQGTTTVNQGILTATVNNALGTTAAGTTVNSGGTLALAGNVNYTTTEQIFLSGTGAGNGALRNAGGDNTFAGTLVTAADSTITSATTGDTLTLNGAISNGFILTVNGAGATVINGVLQDASAAVPVIGDAGFEVPDIGSGGSAYQYNPLGTSWMFTAESGPLGSGVSGNASGFTAGNPTGAPEGDQVAFLQGTATISQVLTFTADGLYRVSMLAAQRGSSNNAIGQTFQVQMDGVTVGTFTPANTAYALQTTADFAVTAGTHTLRFVGTNPSGGDNTAFLDQVQIALTSGTVPGSLVKNGAGTLALTNDNTYTGATDVKGGTLLVDGSITSDTTVTSGGTLGGDGTVTGDVDVQTGGTLAPGRPGSNATLTVTGNVAFVAGAVFHVDHDGAGTSDVLAVGGALGLGTATLQGTVVNPPLTAFTIISTNLGSPTSTRFAGLPNNGDIIILSGQNFAINYAGGDGDDVTLLLANSPPVITNNSGNPVTVVMDEDSSPIAFDLTLNATDSDGDTLTWSIVFPATNGSATASGTGTSKVIGYTPTANYNGTDSFVVQVSDGNGGIDTITVNVTINAVNDVPVITEGASVNVVMDEDGNVTPFALTLNATDGDGDTLTWSIVSPATNGVATASGTGTSKVIGYTPTANYSGTDSFVVQVDDGNGGTDTITVNVTINAVNDDPVITEGPSVSVVMDEDGNFTPFALTLNATDVDSATLTWSIVSPATNGSATASGTGTSKVIGYTPTANYNGTDSFVVQVSDGNGGIDTITVNVTINAVNDAPVITEGASVTVVMSEDGSPTPFSLTLNATDVDGATLTWSIVTPAGNGSATASGTGTSKVIGYTPAANYNGTDSFVVQVSDGTGGTDTITVNVTINAVNDTPSFTPGPNQSVGALAGSQTVPNWATNISAGPPDESGQVLTFLVSNNNSGLFSVQPSIAPNGTLTYTPNPAAVGTATVTVQLTDAGGGADTSAPITFTITVSGPVDAVGVYDPTSATWYLRNTSTAGSADFTPFAYGWAGTAMPARNGSSIVVGGTTPVVGDWDGDGDVTIGVYDAAAARWYLRNTNSAGSPDYLPFAYGFGGVIPVVGDWDGNGTDTVGVYDPSTATWYLNNSNAAGAPSYMPFAYGFAGAIPVVGDWDGDGDVTIGVYNPANATWYLRNSNSAGAPDIQPFAYGFGNKPVVGDWDGDGDDTVGVWSSGTAQWFLRNNNGPGAPSLPVFAYGFGAFPLVGDWNFPNAPLHASGLGAGAVAELDDRSLQATVAGALARLDAAGVDAGVRAFLAGTRFEIGHLPDTYLGLAGAGRVIIDADAAGHGWFVDGTSQDDAEFLDGLAASGSPAAGRMDLLSAVLHELGHVAGLDHGVGVMAETLAAGARSLEALDAFFAR